jgi:hypothetical protein
MLASSLAPTKLDDRVGPDLSNDEQVMGWSWIGYG